MILLTEHPPSRSVSRRGLYHLFSVALSRTRSPTISYNMALIFIPRARFTAGGLPGRCGRVECREVPVARRPSGALGRCRSGKVPVLWEGATHLSRHPSARPWVLVTFPREVARHVRDGVTPGAAVTPRCSPLGAGHISAAGSHFRGRPPPPAASPTPLQSSSTSGACSPRSGRARKEGSSRKSPLMASRAASAGTGSPRVTGCTS